SEDWPTGATQINSLHYADGVIYAGCNNYATSPAEGFVLEFDADTLAHLATHTTGAFWSEGGAFGPNGNFFVCFDNRVSVEEYDASWTLVQTYALDVNLLSHMYQGIVWFDDLMFVNIHEGQVIIKCDVFKWTGSGFYLVSRIDPPSTKCTQGLHRDP